MKIVAITRHFESVPESDFVLMDLDKCETTEEIEFRDEILNCNGEYLENPSKSTVEILCGHDMETYTKLNLLQGVHEINGTIQYGPIVII